jgi:hypothetical protein
MVAETNGEVQDTARRVRRKRAITPEMLAQVTAVFPGFADLHGRLTPSTLYCWPGSPTICLRSR